MLHRPPKNRFGLKQILLLLTLVALFVRLAIFLDPRGSIQGLVVFPEGAIANAEVKVWAESLDGDVYAETSTGTNGQFQFPRLPKGNYNLGINDDDQTAIAVKSFSLRNGYSQAPRIVVRKGAVIQGQVLGAHGQSLRIPPGACVQLHGPSHPASGRPREETIDETGAFRVPVATGQNKLHFVVCTHAFDYSCNIGEGETRSVHFVIAPQTPPQLYFEAPDTGHVYTAFDSGQAWSEALETAGNRRFRGMLGHLVTITSAAENEHLVQWFGDRGSSWTAGSDNREEGTWSWAAGPEQGKAFYETGEWSPRFHNWDRLLGISSRTTVARPSTAWRGTPLTGVIVRTVDTVCGKTGTETNGPTALSSSSRQHHAAT